MAQQRGKVPGSGRKKGTQNKATGKRQEIANLVLAEGCTPLEVMLKAMRWAIDHGDLDAAHGFAKDAAPYVHPRLATQTITGPEGGPLKSEATVTHAVDESFGQLVATLEAARHAKAGGPQPSD